MVFTTERGSAAARRIAIVCATVVFIIAVAILTGWWMDIPPLRSGLFGTTSAHPDAGIVLAALAVALFLRHAPSARPFSLLALLVGMSTAAHYVAGVNPGLTRVLLHRAGVESDFQMSIPATIAAIAAGGAGLLVRRRTIAHLLAALSGMVGLAGVLGAEYGALLLRGDTQRPISISASALLVVWTIGFFAETGDEGLAVHFLAHDRWGRTARRLGLAALVLPAAFGALSLVTATAGWFDSRYAVALVVAATGVALVLITSRYIGQLREMEKRRIAAEEESLTAAALYRTMFETANEGICVLEPDFTIKLANRRIRELLGCTESDVIGRSALDLIDERDHAEVMRRAKLRAEGTSATLGDLRLRHHDGHTVYAISSASRLFDAAGHETVLVMLTDITGRRNAELALRASEAQFRSLYTSNIIGVAFWTWDGRVVQANDALLRMFGVSPDELPEWHWQTRNTPEGQLADEEAMLRVRETGRAEPYVKECVRPDGTHATLLVAAAPLPQSEDTNIAFVIDITESMEARRALERACATLRSRVSALEGLHEALDCSDFDAQREQVEVLAQRLAEASEELETFSYSVSHDLRAPLRAIDGFSRELLDGWSSQLDERGRHYLARIRAATDRMSHLIDDLLELSRLSRSPLRRQSVDVSALARRVATEVADRRGNVAEIRIVEGMTAEADERLLHVVLDNLVDNAVKFSARSPDPVVEVFATPEGSFVVRDNGSGFDPRLADRLFVPFQRLHSSDYEGTGIGLSLVQRIIRRHGGTIRAHSAAGHGATFEFDLGLMTASSRGARATEQHGDETPVC